MPCIITHMRQARGSGRKATYCIVLCVEPGFYCTSRSTAHHYCMLYYCWILPSNASWHASVLYYIYCTVHRNQITSSSLLCSKCEIALSRARVLRSAFRTRRSHFSSGDASARTSASGARGFASTSLLGQDTERRTYCTKRYYTNILNSKRTVLDITASRKRFNNTCQNNPKTCPPTPLHLCPTSRRVFSVLNKSPTAHPTTTRLQHVELITQPRMRHLRCCSSSRIDYCLHIPNDDAGRTKSVRHGTAVCCTVLMKKSKIARQMCSGLACPTVLYMT